ncbi:MAG: hypothetical protein QXF26_10400 [Candidatus Bathyarchaeia archaeon]
MLKEIKINEWACNNCHTVFYSYLDEDALCPECGDSARPNGEATFILRDEEFEKVIDGVIQQECGGCWVYQEGITGDNNGEAEELVNMCTIAKMLEALHRDGCPARGT